jgi:Tfp pilus assembly protein PilZ
MTYTSPNFLMAMGRIFSCRRAFLMATSAIFAVHCGLFLPADGRYKIGNLQVMYTEFQRVAV